MKASQGFRSDRKAVLNRLCPVCDRSFASNDLSATLCDECEYQTVAGRFRAPDVPVAGGLLGATDEEREEYYGRESVGTSERILVYCVYATFLLAMGALCAWGAGALVVLVGR